MSPVSPQENQGSEHQGGVREIDGWNIVTDKVGSEDTKKDVEREGN